MAAFSGTDEQIFIEAVNKLLDHFEENESDILLSKLRKMKFLSKKTDLNLVLYTMKELEFLQQIDNSPPIWQKRPETLLTDDLRKQIKERVICKLQKRKPDNLKKKIEENLTKNLFQTKPDAVIINLSAHNVQIGANNTITTTDSEEHISLQFSKLKLVSDKENTNL